MCYSADVLLRLRTPATIYRGPLYAEQAFAALHQANAQRLPLRLIFGVHTGSVGLFIAAPNILQSLVETQFYANGTCFLRPSNVFNVP